MGQHKSLILSKMIVAYAIAHITYHMMNLSSAFCANLSDDVT